MKTLHQIELELAHKWKDSRGFITLNPSNWVFTSDDNILWTAIYYQILIELGYDVRLSDRLWIEMIEPFRYKKALKTCFKLLYSIPKELSNTTNRLLWWYRINDMSKKNKFYSFFRYITKIKYHNIYGRSFLKVMFKNVFRHKDHPFHDLIKL